MYSDNATNFVGSNNELSKLFQSQAFGELTNKLEMQNLHWHFIPSRSPHMGGLWEAGIKSAKYHISRVTKNALLNYDQFYTLLVEIEACLNSRPLTPLSNDPNDLSPLTPGHFLIGSPLIALPQENLVDVPSNRLNHWQRIQQIKQHFWRRWSLEYLNELQQRTKWKAASKEELQPGALVVLKEDNLPPLAWKMCRIQELHPGSDGHVRVVSVKTISGIVKRPINKVCVLPIE
ncbi:uncharacterized protein LOC135134638 [Zophobas morio]|uniref:uncharacterized protein LOC135134638 n=1 Tax=Zophobas morio TaxID=2755281 RepID=UPI003083AB56